MIALNETVRTKYAYVKNGVIFDIKTTKDEDSCIVEINEETTPYIAVTTKGNVKNLYFDNYIEDGDMYVQEGEGEQAVYKFMKTIHNKDAEKEKSVEFQAYYRDLCEDEIANAIIKNYELGYDDFVNDPSKLGVPRYMLNIPNAEDNSDVEPNGEQIEFNEEYYNNVKKVKVKELILKVGQDTASKYGYDLTDPSSVDDIEISKKCE